ncbi:MAG: nucleotidyltransferase family protein [Bacteroidales bacterium]|nr:nucleotidyltransferase family protein [Bacteroidales bacterium]
MNHNNYIADDTVTIKDAMKKLDKAAIGFLCIYKNNEIFGVITDGDIRRAILNDVSLKNPIEEITNKNFISLPYNFTHDEADKVFKKKDVKHIPVIKNNQLIDIIIKDDFYKISIETKQEKIDAKVVIMAGGKGTRLAPFTNILPKPLIPVGDKSMIEVIMKEYNKYKISEYYISVNYKASMIKAYLEDIKHNYNIQYINEKKPLGTAGALKFVENEFEKPFFVANCDIIIKANYAEIYDFHIKGKYDITLVASMQHYAIPYGVCKISKGGELIKIDEKPEFDFLVNTGMYILNPDVLKIIPKNKIYHITSLIDDTKKRGGKIGVFPVSEKSWVDIGQMKEYKKNKLKIITK